MSVDLGRVVEEAFDKAVAAGRPDLVEKLVGELYLIVRFPAERFPDGPPETVAAAVRSRYEHVA